MSEDSRSEWIARIVGGKSFADVGGLWGLENEKISPAYEAGATDLCMIDFWKADSEWWHKFREYCDNKNIRLVREVVASIENPSIREKVGRQYDVVHCSGVLYHCPNPFLTIRNLMSIARETVLLWTIVMPEIIENEFGRLEFGSEAALCVPIMEEGSLKIVDKYTAEYFGSSTNPGIGPVASWYCSDGTPNYGPWWWLWSADYVRKMLTICGLEVIDSTPQYGGLGHLYLCHVGAAATQMNYGTF